MRRRLAFVGMAGSICSAGRTTPGARVAAYCQWQGMRCHVNEWRGEDRILIDAYGLPLEPEELGMTATYERGEYMRELSVSEVTQLVRERRDIPLT